MAWHICGVVWVWHDMRALCKMGKMKEQPSSQQPSSRPAKEGRNNVGPGYGYSGFTLIRLPYITLVELRVLSDIFLFTHTRWPFLWPPGYAGYRRVSVRHSCPATYHHSPDIRWQKGSAINPLFPWFVIQYFVSRLTCGAHLFATERRKATVSVRSVAEGKCAN